ncbi:Alpha/beta hydrolase fold-3 [Ilyonectria sp. MPI-CAGE-AT-0026]|nr:Alpha/beta hydrolase fold-3 [Ilyonectria sp. MPI-CAGE-AT-0026]
MIHGGGFVMGDNNQMSPLSRVVSEVYGAVVVNTSYRLAPAYKFPTAANDTWDSLTWLADNYQSLGADPSTGFILHGASAGGNLAAVTAQKWLEGDHFPPWTGISLTVPIILEQPLVPEKYKELWFSRDQNADAMVLNKQSMIHIMQSYEPDIHSPDYSPFNSKSPHTGLPPVYIGVCGQDPLRDDGLVYEKVLRDYGVKTKLDVYPGVPHGHVMFPGLRSGTKSFFDTVKSFGWLLGDERSEEVLRKSVPGGEPRWF